MAWSASRLVSRMSMTSSPTSTRPSPRSDFAFVPSSCHVERRTRLASLVRSRNIPIAKITANVGILRSARNDNLTGDDILQTREWDASVYHRVSGPQVSWGRKVLAKLKLRGDELLMDAG